MRITRDLHKKIIEKMNPEIKIKVILISLILNGSSTSSNILCKNIKSEKNEKGSTNIVIDFVDKIY